MELKIGADELMNYLEEVFPQVGGRYKIDSLEPGRVVVRLLADDDDLRPGGTISGPSMFSLADLSVYLVVMAHIGPKALAVTTNASIDFMRKPAPGDMLCDCRLLKLGKVLAVADCLMRSEGQDAPVARASMTYSIPKD